MKKWFLHSALDLILPMILSKLTRERIQKLYIDVIDKLEEVVKESNNEIDDAVLLPILEQLKSVIKS